MGRIMSFDQDGRMVADFDKSEHDFLSRYGRTPEEVLDENAKLRELVRDMDECLEHSKPLCKGCRFQEPQERNCQWFEFDERMRELGVEVSE